MSSFPDYPPGFPLCIDLDGTLVREHTLWHLKVSPWWVVKSMFPPRWPLFKEKMARACDLEKTHWTYHQALMAQLHYWHGAGVTLILVTGAPEKIAHHVAQHVGLFSQVHASSSRCNLVGQRKADFLIQRFGAHAYGYVGDSWKDIPVWKASKDILVVAEEESSLVGHLKGIRGVDQRLFCLPHGFGV